MNYFFPFEFGKHFSKEETKHFKKCFGKDFSNYKMFKEIKTISFIPCSIDFIDVFL